MVNYTNVNTGFQINGTDIGFKFVKREYVENTYPSLVGTVSVPSNKYSSNILSWGNQSTYRQLANSTIALNSITSFPVVMTAFTAYTNDWRKIVPSTLGTRVMAIDKRNNLYGCGLNYYGEIAGATAGSSTVVGTSQGYAVSGGTNVKQVACGVYHTAIIKGDGTLWSSGYNFYGQLGNGASGANSNSRTFVETTVGGNNWIQVACGEYNTYAIKGDGSLWAWGDSPLGNGVNGQSSTSPIQIFANTAGQNSYDWVKIAAYYNVYAGLKGDGTLWTWGLGYGGQATTGVYGHGHGSVGINKPTQLTSNNDWIDVSVGSSCVAAINQNNELWMTGYNAHGALGTGNTTNVLTGMVKTTGGLSWKKVICGTSGAGTPTTIGITTDGQLYSWGNNQYGKAGFNSSFGNITSPTLIYPSSSAGQKSFASNGVFIDCATTGTNSYAIQMDYDDSTYYTANTNFDN